MVLTGSRSNIDFHYNVFEETKKKSTISKQSIKNLSCFLKEKLSICKVKFLLILKKGEFKLLQRIFILCARHPAPKPLSIFITAMPGTQEFSIAKRAVRPLKLVP